MIWIGLLFHARPRSDAVRADNITDSEVGGGSSEEQIASMHLELRYKGAMNRCLFYTAQMGDILRISSLLPRFCLTLGSSSTSNNLDKFASNDGLTSSVVQNLELVDHVASVLGSVLEQS